MAGITREPYKDMILFARWHSQSSFKQIRNKYNLSSMEDMKSKLKQTTSLQEENEKSSDKQREEDDSNASHNSASMSKVDRCAYTKTFGNTHTLVLIITINNNIWDRRMNMENIIVMNLRQRLHKWHRTSSYPPLPDS